MIRALFTASSGMSAQQLNIDVISNNMANVNTAGFKKSTLDFEDLLYQTLQPAGAPVSVGAQVPTGIQVGQGVRPVATQRIFIQGQSKRTDNPLDIMVEGDGFFQILMPDGTLAYTRAGAFKRDSEGRMVTSDGFYLEPQIIIDPDATEVGVATDGTVTIRRSGQDGVETVGQIMLARFSNPAGLEAIGRSLFRTTAASGDAMVGTPGLDGLGSLNQGYLEMSNVQVVEEMVNMIVAQRAYEVNSKVIQAAEDMLQIANNLKR